MSFIKADRKDYAFYYQTNKENYSSQMDYETFYNIEVCKCREKDICKI